MRRFLAILAGIALCAFGIFPVGGGGGCVSGVSQPTPAAAIGLNCLAFYDNFASTSKIDNSNTLQPGFNWYPTNWFFSTTPTPGSDYSVSGNVATINGHGIATGLNSVAPITTSPAKSVGYQLRAPFYIQFDIATNQALAPGSTFSAPCTLGGSSSPRYSNPIIWLEDTSLLFDQINQTTTGGNRGEIDAMEFYVGCSGMGAGNWSPDVGVHIWSAWNTVSNSDQSLNINWGSGTWDGVTFHTVGVLLVTMAKGSGTGSAQWYFDGVYQRETTWTMGSPYAALETSAFTILADSGVAWPVYLRNFQVWQ